MARQKAEPTTMVRMHPRAKEELDKIAAEDRRSILDTLDVVVEQAKLYRMAIAQGRSE